MNEMVCHGKSEIKAARESSTLVLRSHVINHLNGMSQSTLHL